MDPDASLGQIMPPENFEEVTPKNCLEDNRQNFVGVYILRCQQTKSTWLADVLRTTTILRNVRPWRGTILCNMMPHTPLSATTKVGPHLREGPGGVADAEGQPDGRFVFGAFAGGAVAPAQSQEGDAVLGEE